VLGLGLIGIAAGLARWPEENWSATGLPAWATILVVRALPKGTRA
jgi:hypothetical protein